MVATSLFSISTSALGLRAFDSMDRAPVASVRTGYSMHLLRKPVYTGLMNETSPVEVGRGFIHRIAAYVCVPGGLQPLSPPTNDDTQDPPGPGRLSLVKRPACSCLVYRDSPRCSPVPCRVWGSGRGGGYMRKRDGQFL